MFYIFGTSTNAFGERNQWHKHELEGRVDMPGEREEHLLYIGTRGRAIFFFAAMFSCTVATFTAVIAKYSYVFGYIQKSFGRRDFSRTGTISKAAWTCQADERCQDKFYGEDVAFYCLDERSSYH